MSREVSNSSQIDAFTRTFAVPQVVAKGYIAGADDALAYAHLAFGQQYNVTESIASNDGDALHRGDKIHFLGCTNIAETGVLTLYFETTDGETRRLCFNPDAPQEPDTRRYFRNIEDTLRPVLLDLSRRRKKLIAARAVLIHLRKSGNDHPINSDGNTP